MKNTEENETPRYRKKKSQKSKSNHRSDHKHCYEKAIVDWFFGWFWGEACTVCGRVRNVAPTVEKEFLKPEHKNEVGVCRNYFLTYNEIKEAFPGTPVYRYNVEKSDYELVGGVR